MRYGPELHRLKQSYFSVLMAPRKRFILIRHIGTPIQKAGDSVLDWQVPLWVGCGEFACAVTVISHNLTCIPPSVMVQSWERGKRGGLMRWNTCKCLLFEKEQSLGNPLSSLSALCVCVCVCTCMLCTVSCTKELKACRSTFIYSVKFGKVAIIILVEVTTFCNYSVCVCVRVCEV